jgi:phosphatidylethanolamine-binding protein (PEBP) family uncharacterized protein
MNSTKVFKLAISGVGLAAMLFGCSSTSDNTGTGGSGTGGTTSSTGGTPATGGNHGTGGTPATGGTPGTGGVVSTGGTPGTGGSATGGTPGTGGSATGGNGGGGGGHAGGGGGHAGNGAAGSNGTGGSSSGGGASGFSLTSPDLADGAKFDPTMYTCQMNGGTFGSGVNPELDWTGVPAGTMSFVITFIDTSIADKNPTDTKSQHWAIWNIPWDPSTGKVSQFPKATKTLSGDLMSAKQNGSYLAPCAQGLANAPNDDQYAYTIYALSTATLPGSNLSSVQSVLTALKSVTPLGTAVLHGHAGNMGM